MRDSIDEDNTNKTSFFPNLRQGYGSVPNQFIKKVDKPRFTEKTGASNSKLASYELHPWLSNMFTREQSSILDCESLMYPTFRCTDVIHVSLVPHQEARCVDPLKYGRGPPPLFAQTPRCVAALHVSSLFSIILIIRRPLTMLVNCLQYILFYRLMQFLIGILTRLM